MRFPRLRLRCMIGRLIQWFLRAVQHRAVVVIGGRRVIVADHIWVTRNMLRRHDRELADLRHQVTQLKAQIKEVNTYVPARDPSTGHFMRRAG